MQKSRQKSAWQRGVRLATIWKRVRGNLIQWDNRCVKWAKKKNAPAWVGHIPLIAFILFSITTICIGGLLMISAIVIWAALLISSHLKAPVQVEVINNNSPTDYEGYSWDRDRYSWERKRYENWNQND
ncbi:lipid droplet assembly factor 1 [Erwinia mallotivora]|uniref:lipid droplet assembly factor 1 n=1 Tax=Erwinia mallotivora TaxID=69222 RepID=UPI0021C100F1|nr:lipid droplet assembly factor 1 [Erwinia mallotivora]